MLTSPGDSARRRSCGIGWRWCHSHASTAFWVAVCPPWLSPTPSWFIHDIISKAALKESSLASASYRHPRHVIMSQKYTGCHILLHKYRPEKLLHVTVGSKCHPGMAPGKRETEHYHLRVLKWKYSLPASFQLKLENMGPHLPFPICWSRNTGKDMHPEVLLCSLALLGISVCWEGHCLLSCGFLLSRMRGNGTTCQVNFWQNERTPQVWKYKLQPHKFHFIIIITTVIIMINFHASWPQWNIYFVWDGNINRKYIIFDSFTEDVDHHSPMFYYLLPIHGRDKCPSHSCMSCPSHTGSLG